MRTFSETWHRVAGLRVALRPAIRAYRQHFRGEDWYVLCDPLNNRFFRVRPEAYAFVARLTPERTVEAVWNDVLAERPEAAPGQEEVVTLLSQLHLADLLFFRNAADSAEILERIRKRERQEARMRLMSVMFARVPLVNPDRLLLRLMPVLHLIVGPWGAVAWLVVVLAGAKAALDDAAALTDRFQGVLAPANLPLLIVAAILLKAIHEIGHAVVCRRLGGEVHTMGVMFVLLTPMPYVDASSSWGLRHRGHRALVAAAGMLAELPAAAVAALVWANVGDGAVRSLAYNVMVSASVSTLVFNVNPLLRFDGYYILSDLLGIPNLYDRARRQINHLVERHLFGVRDGTPPAHGAGEARWLVLYGVLSLVYRIAVFVAITLTVAGQYLILGLLMAVASVVLWGLVPLFKFVGYLLTSERLAMTRMRAVLVTVAVLGAVGVAATTVPVRNGLRATGVIEARSFQMVHPATPGWIASVRVPSGTAVEAGTVLVQLENPEIEFELRTVAAMADEVRARIDAARSEAIADVDPLVRRAETIAQRLDDLTRRRAALAVTAPQSGVWVAPGLSERAGTWVERGAGLGGVYGEDGWRFTAVVTQEESADLFDDRVERGAVRLWGGREEIPVRAIEIVPFEQRNLPSASLGWLGGGTIVTSATGGGDGRVAREAFFQLRADLSAEAAALAGIHHGRSGVIRLDREPEPLARQAVRSVRQMLQTRYRL